VANLTFRKVDRMPGRYQVKALPSTSVIINGASCNFIASYMGGNFFFNLLSTEIFWPLFRVDNSAMYLSTDQTVVTNRSI